LEHVRAKDEEAAIGPDLSDQNFYDHYSDHSTRKKEILLLLNTTNVHNRGRLKKLESEKLKRLCFNLGTDKQLLFQLFQSRRLYALTNILDECLYYWVAE